VEHIETQKLIQACLALGENLKTEDGVLNTLLLGVAMRLSELSSENSTLVSLLVQHGIAEKIESKPDNIIPFPQKK
jgi:hypothetical protein